MARQVHIYCLLCLLAAAPAFAAALPRANEPVQVALPDYGKEVLAFDAAVAEPVEWTKYVVNAGMGEGRSAPERRKGWLAKHWMLMDYMDRSGDYVSHRWLKHRGIWYEIYGSNEYQETIHFHEKGARELFWDNGIARDMAGERVLSPQYNTSQEWWKKKVGWDAFIVCNNAPRWSAVINYDLLTSAHLGSSTSQDNIGGPTSRIGKGSHGRYCDYCNAKFLHHLEATNRLPEFRQKYSRIRDYVQAHLMDLFRQLPPYNTKQRFSEAEAARIARICGDPVMAEYQKFLYLSHIHNFIRYYSDQKVVAKRLGKHYSVHGNQGGGFMGPNAYQIALSDFVDTVWFESAGESTYDMFKYHWNNAWGAFRFEIGRAMLRGRKPLMCMTKFYKMEPDLVEHELAEPCAGGGVLFVAQHAFAKRPDLLRLLHGYFAFRHEHRAIFANHGKRRHCQVALLHSIPTMMYQQYMAAVAAPAVSAMSGMARALEEGHIPFDVVIFNHPEIHPDYVSLDELKRYRLLILPEIECLSDAQVETIGRYLDSGGTVGLVGKAGGRDENNRPREKPVLEQWRTRGKVVDLTPTPGFSANRTRENEQTRATTLSALAAVREALGRDMILEGDLPRLLWVKTWTHDAGFASLHFVNYDIDFETGRAASTPATRLTVRLPEGVTPEQAQFLMPGQAPQALALDRAEGRVSFELPPIRVYGVVLIGKRNAEEAASATALGDALLARGRFACDGDWGEFADEATRVRQSRPGAAADPEAAALYATAAKELLVRTASREEATYLAEVKAMADIDGATRALDFGGKQPHKGWQKVGADSEYDPKTGFGWRPDDASTQPTPEELHYAMAQRYGRGVPNAINEGYAIFWPYRPLPPEPVNRGLCCGAPRRFRLDLANGLYEVRVVALNPSWIMRNFLVSGMVAANSEPALLDAVHQKGAIRARSFTAVVSDGKLDLTFGGPTGWAVSAVVVRPAAAAAADPLADGALREWRVSPRFANPAWYPIRQVRGKPESNPGQPDTQGWTPLPAAKKGIGLVDLGSNRDAAVGDVVYAAATIEAADAKGVVLHLGASSAAMAWLNGEPVAYLPNVKGVARDEFVERVTLKRGSNVLLLKLCRFWERRWMFYASVTAAE